MAGNLQERNMSDPATTKHNVPRATRVDLPDSLRSLVSKAAEFYGEHPRTIIRLAVGHGLQHLPEVFGTGDFRGEDQCQEGSLSADT